MDADGFGQLFDEHYGLLVAHMRRRGVPWDEAHDLATEVLTVAWRRRDELPPDAVRPWLFGVARRVLANHLRAGRRRASLVARIAGSVPAASLGPEDLGGDEGLAAALRSLSALDREVLLLTVWDGLTHAEAGVVLGLSASGVASRVQRARARLRAALSAHPEPQVGGV